MEKNLKYQKRKKSMEKNLKYRKEMKVQNRI